ncbi:cholinesterase-like [Dermacentor albipictus]|uniref:cholinesterase-like n=1 Tax=Dermacentor albipictus TaxID=60249 RepID=UPI0038FCF74D
MEVTVERRSTSQEEMNTSKGWKEVKHRRSDRRTCQHRESTLSPTRLDKRNNNPWKGRLEQIRKHCHCARGLLNEEEAEQQQQQPVEAMSVRMDQQFRFCVCCVFVFAVAAGVALLVALFVLHRAGASGDAKSREGRVAEENLTVSTNLGPIRGVALQVLDKKVVAYYGVPYAQPPVGARRYRVPQRHAPWSDTFNATEPEDVRCAQVAGGEYFESQANASAEEDCLSIDVFVPKSAYDRSSRPIVVVLHGGGFRTGSNRHPLYDGRWLAGVADVVVAVPNYRLGPLGFLRAGEGKPDAPGNQGLWDQLLAMQWVRANAASFGASPAALTLLGVDSGAVSAGLHLLSPLSRQFFERAVLAGGSPFVMSRYSAFAELDELRQLAATVCDEPQTGLEAEKDEQPLRKSAMACLRAAAAEHIVGSLDEFNGVNARPFGPIYGANDTAEDDFFLPTAAGDSYLLPDEEGVGGAFGGKALVIGYAANEGEYFLRQFVDQWDLESADSLPKPLVRLLLDRLLLHFFGPEQLAELRALYFGDLLADNDGASFSSAADAYLQAASFLGDVLVKCPARMMAELASAGGASVYFYELDYNVNALAMDEGAGLQGRWSGAPHYTDAIFMLGVFLGREVADGSHILATSRRMMGKVGAFARTGVPDRTRDVPWPLYRKPQREMAAISLNRLRIEHVPSSERCRRLALYSRWSRLRAAAFI